MVAPREEASMATMADVARLAGVNPSTVSHVVNGTRSVSGPTRRLVLEAIDATGYRPNALARSLATSSTTTLGLASRFVSNPHFADLVQVIEGRARAAGYTLVLADTHDDPEEELRAVRQFVDRQVDGVLLAPSAHAPAEALPLLASRGVPVVLLDRFADADVDQVAPENVEATAALTGHLADLGHHRIAFVAGSETVSSSAERRRGHLGVVAARGLDADPALVLAGASEADAAERAVLDAFSAADRPGAVVVGNNAMTVGTLRAFRRLALRVPEDVALVAYDDPEWADIVEPRLTTIAQDVPQMARRAVSLVLERICSPDTPARRERVTPTFCHRTSCGCPGTRPADR
jgi:LacI family transcriptional regulator